MTNEQENHLARIKQEFNLLADIKYRKGQAEHGGDLFDLTIGQLINNALDEAIDQVVYLLTMRDIWNGDEVK